MRKLAQRGLSGLVLVSMFSICSRASAAEIDWVRVGTSGQTIVILFQDAGGDAKAIVKQLEPKLQPRITIDGGQPVALNNPIYQVYDAKPWDGPNGLPYVIYPLKDQTIKASDRVTISIPDGWVTCMGGPIAASANRAVENFAGKSLLPPPPTKYTMKLGMDLTPEAWSPIVFRANLMRRGSFYQTSPPKQDVPLGPNGLPTSTAMKLELWIRDDIPDGGDYTLMWDGAGKLALANRELHLKAEQLTGAKDNRRVYSKTSTNPLGWLELQFLDADVRNLRVYPPDVKTDGSQYFNPELMRMLRGVRCIRPYANDVCQSNVSTFDEFPEDRLERRKDDTAISANIIRVEPDENRQRFFLNGWSSFKFTTDKPHHFKTGYTGHLTCSTPVSLTTGKTVRINNDGIFRVLSPTEFAFGYWVGGLANNKFETVKESSPITGKATVIIAPGDWWLSEVADLVNANPGCDLWWSVPYLMEDDSLHQMFALFAKRLAPGRKIHVEYGNEVWNWSYSGTDYAWGMSMIDPDPSARGIRPWYTKRSAQVWAIAREEFAKAGRPDDVRGVICCQPGNCTGSLDYAAKHHITIDEIAVAPYYNVGPGSRWDSAPYDSDAEKRLDPDQICDLADMNVQYNNLTEKEMGFSLAQLKKANFKGKFVTYEGSPEVGCFPTMDEKTAELDSRGWAVHPRMGPWLTYFFQNLQDKFGISLMNYYCLNHGYTDGWGKHGIFTWATYIRWNQPDGVGDGSDGQFNNLSDLLSDQCVSVKGWAIHHWIDHVNAATTQPAN